MNPAPAYQVYANEEFTKAGSLTNAELGALTRARNWSWIHGALPSDDDRRRRIMQVDVEDWPATWDVVKASLIESSAGWTFPELEDQRTRHAAFREKQAAKGRASGEARRKNHGSTTVQPEANHGSTTAPTGGEPEANSSIFDLQSSISSAEERTSPSDAQRPETLVSLWNELTTQPIPRCRELTTKRRAHAATRLREHPIEEWRDVIGRIERSAFCRGANDRAWKATFDWLVQSADTRVKVLEGKYDGPQGGQPVAHQTDEPDWFEECKRLHGGACGLDRHRHHHQLAVDRLNQSEATA